MKVALLCDIIDRKISFNEAYYHYAKRFGEVELITPFQEKIIDNADLLILPGGADVLPARYNEVLDPRFCGSPNFNYEYFDSFILPQYINAKIPTFGICRGLQTLNVFFGGSLNQHINEYSSSYRSELVHEILTIDGQRLKVNSLHHQSVKELGEDLRVVAKCISKSEKKKGETILKHCEAFEHKDLPVAAVQFHPEELCYQGKDYERITAWVNYL